MIQDMIQTVIDRRIKEHYPHVQLAAGMLAEVTKVKEGESVHEYNLKMLNESRTVDERFPEIPSVKSDKQLEIGDIVAVLLLYGQLDVYIIGKAVE
ncbi:hypothetical protein J6TS7_02820 [Paenibacillus dendritiformis]|uniref:hypothetical protein n=1 Tax=Paenibacillus TaxID=44249 RepID=UPI001B01727C|nr:hypothetical protein [Paenibacillus dendritiformis]GIO76672.1 hypothetical protein J6TS7_02820 [Paenibacillus dendritiformis]